MNRAQWRSLIDYSRSGRRVGRDQLEAYARAAGTQPQRTRAALAQIAEIQRMLDTPRKPATLAGWEEFVDAATTIG